MKARLFVGSSVENLEVAYAVQENLEHDCEVTVWPEGIFEPSKTTLQQLLAVSDSFDFAAFVFGADDIAVIRREAKQITRDNVVFELGLFIGRLGSERCFVLTPRRTSNLRLPTDLLGLTPATYDGERVDGNTVAGLGTACNMLRRVIKRLGTRRESPASKSAAARVTAGIASEVREELTNSKVRKVPSLDALTQQLTDAVQGIATASSVDHPSEILKKALTLSTPSVALCRALARRHLTQAEYYNLQSDPLASEAIRELRRAGLLVPLVDPDKARVYWFAPGVWKLIHAAISLMESQKSLDSEIGDALTRVGYR